MYRKRNWTFYSHDYNIFGQYRSSQLSFGVEAELFYIFEYQMELCGEIENIFTLSISFLQDFLKSFYEYIFVNQEHYV